MRDRACVRIDYGHPNNPGDTLHFSRRRRSTAGTRPHAAALGEFLLYDEYDPRRAILFNADGEVWSCTAYAAERPYLHRNTDVASRPSTAVLPQLRLRRGPDDHGCVESLAERQPASRPAAPRATATTCSSATSATTGSSAAPATTRSGAAGATTCSTPTTSSRPAAPTTATAAPALARGHLAQRRARHAPDLRGPRLRRRRARHPDRQHRRRPADRLGRRVQQLHRAVRAVRHRHGEPPGAAGPVRVPLRAVRSAGRRPDARRGPERRLRRPQRRALRRDRPGHAAGPRPVAGPDRRPTDPQAGNIPGGKRDVLRTADFNDGDDVRRRRRQRRLGHRRRHAERLGRLARRRTRQPCSTSTRRSPVYYELLAQTSGSPSRPAGWKANAYLIFDYFVATDFKFAGIDRRRNKAVMGHRTADGLDRRRAGGRPRQRQVRHVLRPAGHGQRPRRHGLRRRREALLSYQFDPRYVDGQAYGLNMGLVGVGSDNARGTFDNLVVQALPPAGDLRQDRGLRHRPPACSPVRQRDVDGHRLDASPATGGVEHRNRLLDLPVRAAGVDDHDRGGDAPVDRGRLGWPRLRPLHRRRLQVRHARPGRGHGRHRPRHRNKSRVDRPDLHQAALAAAPTWRWC